MAAVAMMERVERRKKVVAGDKWRFQRRDQIKIASLLAPRLSV